MKPSAKPQLPSRTDLEVIDGKVLVTEARLDQVVLSNVEAISLHASNMNIQETILEKVLFTEAKLEKLSLMDVELLACDLSAATCLESSFIRTHFVGGRMTGIDLSRSTLKDVVFEDCKLDMTNFRFSKLTRVRFINCVMSEADFQVAELTDITFEGSELDKVEFGQCKLKNVDARSSQLFDIRGWQSLKGLTIDSTQLASIAPQLAMELGLIVKE
jgi:uncharacterized protein YjbI with pentapeptide repeats